MATQLESNILPQFPPTRPSKLTYLAGAVLFVLFAVFVMAQPVIPPEAQPAGTVVKKQG